MKYGYRISSTLAAYVIFVFVVLGVLLYGAFYYQITDSMLKVQNHSFDNQVNFIKRDIEDFIQQRVMIVENMSRYSYLAHYIIKPEENRANINDFISETKIMHKHYPVAILNNKGYVVGSSYETVPGLPEKINTTKDEPEKSFKVFKLEDKFFFRLSTPVIHDGRVIGKFLVDFPFSDIGNALNNSGVYVKISYAGKIVGEFGTVAEGFKKNALLNKYGISIDFVFDTKKAKTERNILMIKVFILLFVISIMAIISAVILGKKVFVAPLRRLKKEVQLLSTTRSVSIKRENYRIAEYGELYTAFIRMTNSILRRERSLEENNVKLKNTVDELNKAIEKVRSTQSQMVHQEKLASIGQLAAGVAHELNNPIGFVSSNFSVLKSYFSKIEAYLNESREILKKACPEEQLQELEALSKKHKIDYIIDDIGDLFEESGSGFSRISNIVQSLRDFSRVDSDGLEQSYNINEGLANTLTVAKNEVKYVADVETDYGDIPELMTNGGEINQVFLNIVVNAAQAIKEQGRKEKGLIKVKTWADSEKIFCEISDDGPGIPDEFLGRIFDPFFTTKDPGKGTGLGLSISYDIIVNKYHGNLSVFKNDDIGMTFKIELPVFSENN